MKGIGHRTLSAMLVLILMFTLVMMGCSKEEQTSSSDSNKGGEGQEQVIKLWMASDAFGGENSPGMQMVKEFNEKYKGKIRVEVKRAPWEQHNTMIQAAFASGDTPDIFQLPLGAQISKYVSSDLIRPITGLVSDKWTENFYEGSFQEGVNQIDGKIYSWSLEGPSLNHMLYYNKDVLKKAGLDPNKPPKTWDELRDMAKKVTEQGKGDTFGLVFSGGGPATFTRLVVAGFANGASKGSNYDGFNYLTGRYEMDSKAWVDSVELLLSLKKDGSILPSSFTLKVPEAQILFGEGKAAFLLDGRWAMNNIKTNTPNTGFGMTHTPTQDGSAPVYGYHLAAPNSGIVVSKNTKHPEAVAKFIEEGIASKSFYQKFIKDGVALSPMPEVNEDKANYPYPEYEQLVQLHNNVLRLAPSPYARNPEQALVYSEVGGLEQTKLKPSFAEELRMLLNETEKDVAGKLKETAERFNKGLEGGIEKVKAKGANVSLDDYSFPNWNPTEDFKYENYQSIKK